MSQTAIFVRRALTPSVEIPNAVVLIEDGKISAIASEREVRLPASARRLDKRDFTLVPGFIDVHVHGSRGHDSMEGTDEALAAITTSVASHGTTSIIATTVTASEEVTCRAADAIAGWIARVHKKPQSSSAAEILGIHFEGPFISKERRGVHPAEWIQPPSVPLLRALLSAARGTARILTLAPELPNAADVIQEAVRSGLIVSLGHTDATYCEASAAISLGARHATHVFNAMRPFSHRETGVLGAVLTIGNVTAELIADGIHVDNAAIRLLIAAKGMQNVILVSDATAATGMPDSKYKLGTFEVTVAGGVARNAEGKLAGSTLTLDRALRHMVSLGVPLADALAMVTSNPARLVAVEGRKGMLTPGADADLVFLTDKLEVAGVMTRGVASD